MPFSEQQREWFASFTGQAGAMPGGMDQGAGQDMPAGGGPVSRGTSPTPDWSGAPTGPSTGPTVGQPVQQARPAPMPFAIPAPPPTEGPTPVVSTAPPAAPPASAWDKAVDAGSEEIDRQENLVLPGVKEMARDTALAALDHPVAAVAAIAAAGVAAPITALAVGGAVVGAAGLAAGAAINTGIAVADSLLDSAKSAVTEFFDGPAAAPDNE